MVIRGSCCTSGDGSADAERNPASIMPITAAVMITAIMTIMMSMIVATVAMARPGVGSGNECYHGNRGTQRRDGRDEFSHCIVFLVS